MTSAVPVKNDSVPVISAAAFEAVIFDLDGVVTDTAELHASAWKRLFDAFLQRVAAEDQRPFDRQADYLAFVDGKPRYEGVRSFIKSRGIELPDGEPGDPPGAETICGLGNAKNRLFLDILKTEGARVYSSSVALLRQLRSLGFATAIVSSSENCRAILSTVGIADLFDARVDGVEARRLDLEGKPAPDTFLEAASRLNAAPERCVVVEDALSGVEAGRRGGFGLVIGVDRHGQAAALRHAGADTVIADLAWIRLQPLPSALSAFERIARALHHRHAVLCLDYDGTLTPIRDRPEQALLADDMRRALFNLAGLCPVAVISGRDLATIRDLVGLETLIYAGSHGFEIEGPGGLTLCHADATDFLPSLDVAGQQLATRLKSIPGASVERKRFAIAAHYRLVEPARRPTVEAVVDQVLRAHPDLTKTRGKMVFELRPRLDWDKGKAVLWLLDTLGLDRPGVVPIYLGDDVTDEDAFRVLHGRGIGIQVSEKPCRTAAAYRLRDPEQVREFLGQLAQVLSQGDR